MIVDNLTFLKAVFSEDYKWTHVTSFPDNPSNISNENRLRCWAGNYYSRESLQPNANQYFTISTFMADNQGKARRRKNLFRCCHVIVADDVVEKLPVENVQKLPPPSYKLQTSPGSEQWGWILDQPCQDRSRVENLLDGLVAKGLAPAGKDPGMKGVTRYVRLPEGVNTKASKLVNGRPNPCHMVEWHPDRRVSLEALAEPFGVDLDAERRDARVDGASDVPDHPLLQLNSIISVKEIRSAGRFDVVCPWVAGHTGQADDGAAIFTNKDGTIGFKCHHGTCQERTGRDLLEYIEQHRPGFRKQLDTWRVMHSFSKVANVHHVTDSVNPGARMPDFMGTSSLPIDFMGAIIPEPPPSLSYQDIASKLKSFPPTSPEATQMAYEFLRLVDDLDYGSRLNWWNLVRDHMDWSKQDLQGVLDQQRKIWYPRTVSTEDFYKSNVFVAEQNQFYDVNKKMWLTAEGFQNYYAHLDPDARHTALLEGKVEKVDRIDYSPGMDKIYTEKGVTYVNGWTGRIEPGVPGDVSPWLNHFSVLGWEKHQKHILQWMAYTLLHPERKINHILLFAGGEGVGKDWLLQPLINAMGDDSTSIYGGELLADFSDYLLSKKYIHIDETQLSDHKEADSVYNKLKPLAAAPPDYIRVNIKNKNPFRVRNIVNCSMSSNHYTPVTLSGDSRRFFGVWTDIRMKDNHGNILQEYAGYWDRMWAFMRDTEGWKRCVYYLRNNVDISDFDPGKTPVVTDYIRDIQRVTEDPLSALVKEFVSRRLSLMGSDIVTSADIRQSLKTAAIANTAVELKSVPGAQIIGKIMRQNGIGVPARIWGNGKESRVWIIRNHALYLGVSGKDLHSEYYRQMNALKSDMPMSVVK